ncbi:hypothetical protein D3C71_1976580 [compost metagenome]
MHIAAGAFVVAIVRNGDGGLIAEAGMRRHLMELLRGLAARQLRLRRGVAAGLRAAVGKGGERNFEHGNR